MKQKSLKLKLWRTRLIYAGSLVDKSINVRTIIVISVGKIRFLRIIKVTFWLWFRKIVFSWKVWAIWSTFKEFKWNSNRVTLTESYIKSKSIRTLI